MAERFDGDRVAANGFGRQYLHEWEARALNEARYLMSPDFLCRSKWRLSAGGIPIPPKPHGATRVVAIHQHFYGELTPEQQEDAIWDPENNFR
jgi:hypothetical protein